MLDMRPWRIVRLYSLCVISLTVLFVLYLDCTFMRLVLLRSDEDGVDSSRSGMSHYK